MSDDHTYCRDPHRLFRNLKKKFDVLSVEQDELNNDIPCPGDGMQGKDKLYLTCTTSRPAQPSPLLI